MKHHIHTKGRLWRLTWPIFLETFLIMFLGMTDVFMLGKYSDLAVASVGVVNQLLNMVFLLFGVVTTGTAVLCARYLGARDSEGLKQVIGVSLVFNLVFSLAISALLFFGGHQLLFWMNLQPDLMPDGLIYIQVVGGFAFVQAVSLTLSAVLRSLQKPGYALTVIVVVNLVNLWGNYALIYGHFGFESMGVLGSAIATVLARVIAAVLLGYFLFYRVIHQHLWAIVSVWRNSKLKELLQIGIPSAGEHLSYSFSMVVITYLIIQLGNEALIARTYAVNFAMLSYLFSHSVGQSGSILTGFFAGRKNYRTAHLLVNYGARITLMVTVCIGVLLALLSPTFIAFFTPIEAVWKMFVWVMWIDVLLELGRAFNLIYIMSLRSAGDYRYPVYVGLFSMWLIAVGLGYALGIGLSMGLVGMWLAFTLDELVRGTLMYRRWNQKIWKNKNL